MSKSQRRAWVSVVAAAVTAAVLSSGSGWGQVRRTTPAGEDAQPDKNSPLGVTIPLSPGASERLDKARDKENQKQWKTAAEFYTDAVTQFSGRVVPGKIDKRIGIYQYTGIGPAVQERLSKWPADGLKVYDNLYDKTAADLLASAGPGDVGAVQAVFWDYFVTPAGKQAGIRLVDTYLEAGDFPSAAWVANRLLTMHPSLGGDWGMVAYRAITADHYAGDDGLAAAVLHDLKAKPDETGSIGGKDVRLVDAADAVMATPVPTFTAGLADADTWPGYGGIGGCGQVNPSAARPGAPIASVRMDPPDYGAVAGPQKQQNAQMDEATFRSFQAMGVMPAVDGGQLFFQDGRNLYAVDVDSGSPLTGWLTTYPGTHNGHFKLNVTGRPRNETLTVTLTPTRVLAVMGQMDRGIGYGNYNTMQFDGGGSFPSTAKLVCLDRTTGKELWVRTPSDLPEAAGTMRAGAFGGSPLVVPARFAGKSASDDSFSAPEDSILVCVRGGKDNQFDDCYVVCLSARTGEYRWSTYVGSANRANDYGYGGMMGSQDPSQLALSNGRVLVMSNLGTFAALDPADGRVVWLNGYARDNGQTMVRRRMVANDESEGMQTASRPWTRNPIVVSEGKVFALPTDSKILFVYDAESGAELKRVPLTNLELTDPQGPNSSSSFRPVPEQGVATDLLIGVRGDLVYLASYKSVYAIDWKNYDPAHAQLAIRAKKQNLAGAIASQNGPTNILLGRAFLTADSLFICSNENLFELDPDKLTVKSMYPSQGGFLKESRDRQNEPGPGNIVVTSQGVIVAGQKRVDVYTELALVRAKYLPQLAANPDDIDLRIRYIDVLYAGGRPLEAVGQIDIARDRLGGAGQMRSGPARQKIYTAVLDLAHQTQDSWEAAGKAESPLNKIPRNPAAPTAASLSKLNDQLFDRVIDAADAPVERATGRLDRAVFEHKRKNYGPEVDLCQQVLSDPQQRDALVEEDSAGGQKAEAMIGVVLKDDKSAYAEIETRASSARDDAGTDNDKLLAVSVEYPNSEAGKAACQTVVSAFEADKKILPAIEILRRLYVKLAGSHDAQSTVLTRIAADYLLLPDGINPALDRLSWACRLGRLGNGFNARLPQAITLPDGTTLSTDVTFAEAIRRLRSIENDTAAASLPDFHIAPNADGRMKDPFTPGDNSVISQVAAVVHPLSAYPCYTQILTWSAAGLAVYPVGQTTPLATIKTVREVPLAAARIKDKWVVWTSTAVFQVSATDGRLDWTFKLSSLPSIPVTPGVAFPDDPGAVNIDPNNPQQQALLQQQQMQAQIALLNNGGNMNGQVRRMRNGRVVFVGGQPGGNQPVPEMVSSGIEQIVNAHVAGDRLVGTTSEGRVFALKLIDGTSAWQSRPADRSPNQSGANAAYCFARFDVDQLGAVVVVWDSSTGRVIGRRKFGPDGTLTQLVNVAISEEGTLVMTLLTKAEVLNLYDPWKITSTQLTANRYQNDNENYTGLNQQDQLLVAGGRVSVLYDTGRYVRTYDLTRESDATLPQGTGGGAGSAWLRTVGSELFILNTDTFSHYRLLEPAKPGDARPDPAHDPYNHIADRWDKENARQLFVGNQYVVVLDDPVNRGPTGSPLVRLLFYYRGPVGKTTPDYDRLEYVVQVPREPADNRTPNITEWMAVEGGFYYQTLDQKLHFLSAAETHQ